MCWFAARPMHLAALDLPSLLDTSGARRFRAKHLMPLGDVNFCRLGLVPASRNEPGAYFVLGSKEENP
jgi:hypothetical protein